MWTDGNGRWRIIVRMCKMSASTKTASCKDDDSVLVNGIRLHMTCLVMH